MENPFNNLGAALTAATREIVGAPAPVASVAPPAEAVAAVVPPVEAQEAPRKEKRLRNRRKDRPKTKQVADGPAVPAAWAAAAERVRGVIPRDGIDSPYARTYIRAVAGWNFQMGIPPRLSDYGLPLPQQSSTWFMFEVFATPVPVALPTAEWAEAFQQWRHYHRLVSMTGVSQPLPNIPPRVREVLDAEHPGWLQPYELRPDGTVVMDRGAEAPTILSATQLLTTHQVANTQNAMQWATSEERRLAGYLDSINATEDAEADLWRAEFLVFPNQPVLGRPHRPNDRGRKPAATFQWQEKVVSSPEVASSEVFQIFVQKDGRVSYRQWRPELWQGEEIIQARQLRARRNSAPTSGWPTNLLGLPKLLGKDWKNFQGGYAYAKTVDKRLAGAALQDILQVQEWSKDLRRAVSHRLNPPGLNAWVEALEQGQAGPEETEPEAAVTIEAIAAVAPPVVEAIATVAPPVMATEPEPEVVEAEPEPEVVEAEPEVVEAEPEPEVVEAEPEVVEAEPEPEPEVAPPVMSAAATAPPPLPKAWVDFPGNPTGAWQVMSTIPTFLAAMRKAAPAELFAYEGSVWRPAVEVVPGLRAAWEAEQQIAVQAPPPPLGVPASSTSDVGDLA